MEHIWIAAEIVKGLAIFTSLGIVGICLKIIFGGRMNSHDYRRFVKTIIKNAIRKKFPGLKTVPMINEVANEAAKAIHARFYGSAVDDVASPLWRDDERYDILFSDAKATKTAQEILND